MEWPYWSCWGALWCRDHSKYGIAHELAASAMSEHAATASIRVPSISRSHGIHQTQQHVQHVYAKAPKARKQQPRTSIELTTMSDTPVYTSTS